jgi:hypothetical protein
MLGAAAKRFNFKPSCSWISYFTGLPLRRERVKTARRRKETGPESRNKRHLTDAHSLHQR